MTIAELELTLPNGFHDACLVEIAVNFESRVASLLMLLDVSATDSEASIRKPAKLLLHRLNVFLCDGPDISRARVSSRPVTVSGFKPTTREFPTLGTLPPGIKAQLFGFYVLEWNSFIQVAAEEAELCWITDDEEK